MAEIDSLGCNRNYIQVSVPATTQRKESQEHSWVEVEETEETSKKATRGGGGGHQYISLQAQIDFAPQTRPRQLYSSGILPPMCLVREWLHESRIRFWEEHHEGVR